MKNIPITILVLLLVGCTDPKQEQIDQLKVECIGIHDEVMPRMGEIADRSSALKKWRKELEQDTLPEIMTLRQEITVNIHWLDSAHEAMMSWMANYEPKMEDHSSVDSAIVYYNQEKEQIARVKTLTEKSIDDANELLGKRP